jgi:hypothetical protein
MRPRHRPTFSATVVGTAADGTNTFVAELPGIEPVAKSRVSCGNAEFDNAKRRETT